MTRVTLVPLHEIRTPVQTELKDVLSVYTEIQRSGIITRPIVIDEKTSVALKGYGVLEALDLLSAYKVPVLKVDVSKVEIMPKEGIELTPDSIIKAGLQGPKLRVRSFDVMVHEGLPEVRVKLEELMMKKRVKDLRVFNSTIELLYKNWPTPLVKLESLSDKMTEVWAKLESFNPFSNSVKDRIGWAMLQEAIENGCIGDLIYEATSTNTGIALSSIGNKLCKVCKLYIPKTIQRVSDVFLKVLGADVVRMDVGLTVEAVEQVIRDAEKEGAAVLNQFENDTNFMVHLKYTAREIDEQLTSIGKKPTHIVGGLGTSGHMGAISYYFKSKYGDEVKIIGVQPAKDEVIPGIRRIETGMKWYHMVKFDEVVDVKAEEAIEGAIKIARTEGLLIGLSSGAVVHGLSKVKDEGTYVLVFPDSGYKYGEQFETYFKAKGELS